MKENCRNKAVSLILTCSELPHASSWPHCSNHADSLRCRAHQKEERFHPCCFRFCPSRFIDKPLGFIIFHGFGNDRLIAHALLFNLVLLATFLIFRPVLKRWLGGNPVVIPLAAMLHIVEDRMWEEPAVLFYPFMGSIPVKPVLTFSQRIRNILNAYHNPYIFVSEAAGSVILCFLLYVFYRKLEKI